LKKLRGSEVWLKTLNGNREDPHRAIRTDASAGGKAVDPVAGKTVAEILGEIVWLMTQDPAGREMKVAEIEALVMPAILMRQFKIEYAYVNAGAQAAKKALQPISVTIFALFSKEKVTETKAGPSVTDSQINEKNGTPKMEVMKFTLQGLHHGQ